MAVTKIGPYEILEELGAGGMATVYLARQESMGRLVAVKVIHKAIIGDPTTLERFQREAQIIARLEHPHILPVYDYDGRHVPPYIVMRYLPTGTLKDILEKNRLPLEDIAHIYQQLGSALDYAHRQGVIHRDIKPSNIMVDGDGNIFVTDFGIARMTEGGQHLTATGMAVGTPGYMAPEQSLSAEIDGRADVYSLGTMLFEILTGRLPYMGDTPMAVLLKHINDPIPSLRSIDPNASEELDQILQKALAKKPSERYQTCSELARALQSLIKGGAQPLKLKEAAQETIAGIRVDHQTTGTYAQDDEATRVDSMPAITGATSTIAPSEDAKPPSRNGLWMGLGLLLLLGVIAIGAFLAFSGGEEDSAEKTEVAVEISDTPTRTATIAATESTPEITEIATEISETETATVVVEETEIPTDTPTETKIPSPTDTATHTPTDTPSPTDTLTSTPTQTDTPTDTPTATDTPSDARAEVRVARGTIFTEPDFNSQELMPVVEGVEMLVIGETPDGLWYQVEFLGQTGWIFAQQIEVSGNFDTIAIVISPTPTDTDTPTATPTFTVTPSPTDTASPTATDTTTATFTATPSLTSTATPTIPPTATLTPTPTEQILPSDTPIPTATPIPPGTLPFIADMEAEDTLALWQYDPSQWQQRTDGGNTAIYGTTGLESAMTVMGNAVPQWVQPGAEDLLISFRINLIQNNSGGRFIFKFDPNYGYYVIEIFPGTLVLKRGQPGATPNRGTEREIGRVRGTAEILAGRWYEFTIWAEGSRTFVYQEKKLVINEDDREVPLPPGAILLQTFSDRQEVGWDDFIVQLPETASEHFETSTFPTTWERSSQQNVNLMVDGNSQVLQMEGAAEVSPILPPMQNFILYARLNNTSVSFQMFVRESPQGSLGMDWDAGNVVLTQYNANQEVVWTTTLRNYYARARYKEFVITLIGERLTVYDEGDIILEEELPGLSPSGTVRFKTDEGDGLRIDDFLIAETELSSTADARFAFEILETLRTRVERPLRWDWDDDFTDKFRTDGWWEGDPGEHFIDENVDFNATHRRYYILTATDLSVFRRIRPEIDSTRNVFGFGEDRANYRDSSDLYIKIDIRIPEESPSGSEAWLGIRSTPNASGGLFQYRLSLVKDEIGNILVRISPETQTNRTPFYQEVLEVNDDGWIQIIVVTLDDQIAFFADGRLLTAVRGVELLGGTLAIGVEPNTTAQFDDLIFRDTSVNE